MPTTTLDLYSLNLSHGEGRRVTMPILIGEIELGGQTYEPTPATVPAKLDVSRTSSGFAFRIDFSLRLEGPCVRCLDPASVEIEVEAREAHQPDGTDEEFVSPYMDEDSGEIDVGRWARDAAVLALPAQILCRPDCPGLCPTCGVNLKGEDPADHRHGEEIDPRWAKLSELDSGT